MSGLHADLWSCAKYNIPRAGPADTLDSHYWHCSSGRARFLAALTPRRGSEYCWEDAATTGLLETNNGRTATNSHKRHEMKMRRTSEATIGKVIYGCSPIGPARASQTPAAACGWWYGAVQFISAGLSQCDVFFLFYCWHMYSSVSQLARQSRNSFRGVFAAHDWLRRPAKKDGASGVDRPRPSRWLGSD